MELRSLLCLCACTLSPGVIAFSTPTKLHASRMPRPEASRSLRMQTPAPTSQRVKLGWSDMQVSTACLGTMTWGQQNTQEEAEEQLDMAVKKYGINFIDTAEAYPIPLKAETQGETERILGKWMAKEGSPPREDLIIASKVCGPNARFTWIRGGPTKLSKEQIIKGVDDILERLGTDYLDILQFHWPDRYVPLFGDVGYMKSRERPHVSFEEQVEAVGELIAAGKIKHWGLSNETPYGVSRFCEAARKLDVQKPVSVQNSYSLMSRSDEIGLSEVCSLEKIAYLAYSPLSAGSLSGKYEAMEDEFGSFDAMTGRFSLFPGYMENYRSTSAPLAVRAYSELAKRFKMTPAQFAIAFCQSRSHVTSTILGCTNTNQLEDNMGGFAIKKWTEEMEDGVRDVYKNFPDPWRMLVRNGG